MWIWHFADNQYVRPSSEIYKMNITSKDIFPKDIFSRFKKMSEKEKNSEIQNSAKFSTTIIMNPRFQLSTVSKSAFEKVWTRDFKLWHSQLRTTHYLYYRGNHIGLFHLVMGWHTLERSIWSRVEPHLTATLHMSNHIKMLQSNVVQLGPSY